MNIFTRFNLHSTFIFLLTILTIVSGSYGCMNLRALGALTYASRAKRNTNKTASNRTPGDLTTGSFSAIAKQRADGKSAGSRVLSSAVGMIENKTIVVGSCWDYVNKAYDTAGFPADKRAVVYRDKEDGPYADPLLIKPGDWIMFKNLTFGGIGHSAIFVEWLDFESRSALTIEYAGLNRHIPGRFREYDITKCFGLVRGKK